MHKVVVTAKISPEGPHNQIFADGGFAVAFPPKNCDVFQEDALIGQLRDADAVLAGSEPYTKRVLAALPKLRVIARAGVGFDAIDLAACDAASIPVCTTPGVNHHSVAEHTIALLMAIARGFPELDRKVRQNRWDRRSYPRVMGKTLGILGLGRIGQAVATRGVGLGMKVIALEPYPDQAFVKQWNIELVDLEHGARPQRFPVVAPPHEPREPASHESRAVRKNEEGGDADQHGPRAAGERGRPGARR